MATTSETGAEHALHPVKPPNVLLHRRFRSARQAISSVYRLFFATLSLL